MIRNVALDWRRPLAIPLEDAPSDELAHPNPELAVAERTIGFRAFRALPERWQTVLWYLEIEGMEPAQAAPLLGLSPNATSALAVRAREGFKRAWLQAHVNETSVPDGCTWTTSRLGEYTRGGLTRRGRERFDAHLEECERCTGLLAEIGDASGRLAVLLLPLLLGSSGAAALLAQRPDPGASASPSAPSPVSPSLGVGPPRLPLLVGLAAAATAAVVATAALALSTPGDPVPSAPVAEEPGPVATEPPPTPEPEPPAAAPEPSPVSPRIVPRIPPVTAPPVVPPVAPPSPSTPVIVFDPATGRIAATGSGDVPGATIELVGTTTSSATGVTSPPTLLASVVVSPDGTWTTPEASGITPLAVTVVVRQVRSGLASAPVELIASAIFWPTTPSTVGTVSGGVATWQLDGWPGAAWELREPSGGPTVAAGTFDAAGTAIATVVLPALPSGTVVSYDYGYVHDGAIAVVLPGLTATIP